MKAMQIILPLICFAAGMAVAWALLQPRLAVLAERAARVPELDGRVATLRLLRIRDWQRAQPDGINQLEDRRVRSDPKGERHHCHRCKRRI